MAGCAGIPACFVVDSNLLLQSTNLPDETVASASDVANLDWQLSNEPSQFQLSGSNITRWLASVGGSVHDAAQSTGSLLPMYSAGGALMSGSRYLVGGGAASDWTFLHRPGTLFMVLRPDSATTGYLLGTVHDSSASAGSGFGIYFDASFDPPRARIRVGNGSASYVYALNTVRAFPMGVKAVLAVTMSDTKLEAFLNYDSIGSDANTGSLATSAPFSVALVGARPSASKIPFPGAIFEVDHYSGAMSQRARQAMVQYLLKKHGIEGSPAHCQNAALDTALGEISADCGGECGCTGACASQCGLTTRDFDPSDDGSYYKINLLRRAPGLPQPSASVTFTNDAVLWGSLGVSYATDADDSAFQWYSPTGSDPDATATVVYDLGTETKVGAVRHRYGGSWIMPNRYRIRVGSASVPTVWTEVVPDTVNTSYDNLNTFAGVSGRYVELSMIGTPPEFGTSQGMGVVDLAEIHVFPSTSQVPAPNTNQGYDLSFLNGVTTTVNSNVSGWYWTLTDKQFTGLRGKTVAEGATGDAQATIDLHGLFQVSQIVLSFHLAQLWENGGKIELGVDGPTPGSIVWNTVLDTGLGVPLGTYPGNYPITPQLGRYLRITNYFVAGQGASTGQLDEVGIF